jgi:hypothetical protein
MYRVGYYRETEFDFKVIKLCRFHRRYSWSVCELAKELNESIEELKIKLLDMEVRCEGLYSS